MAKNSKDKTTLGKKRDETASVVASIAGCTPSNVRMVMAGKVDNERILEATILYQQGKNELIKYIEQIVPFN